MRKWFALLVVFCWIPSAVQAQDSKRALIQKAFQAVEANDMAMIKDLVQDKEILAATDAYGNSLLYNAILYDRESIVKFLLDSGAEIDIETKFEDSPLALACRKGHYPIFSLLVQKGAALVPADRLMLAAARGGNFEIIKFLIEKKLPLNVQAENGMSPLHYALERGDRRLAYDLYENDRSLGGLPLLIHSAASSGDTELIGFALKLGNGIDSQDLCGWTPLHTAIFHGKLEAVRFLLKEGASPDAETTEHYERRNDHVLFIAGSTPLDFAVLNNDRDIAAAILEKTSPKEFHGRLAHLFNLAQAYGYQDMGRFLISRATELNGRDELGWTLLHHAALGSDAETIDLILQKGADPNARTGKDLKDPWHREYPAGSTAEQIAQVTGNENLAKAFARRGLAAAEPNAYKLTLHTTDNEISIAPDGSIWIVVPPGMIYFAENAETTWLSVRFNLDLLGLTQRITWIDSQTALVTGSMSVNGRRVLKRTVDRGKTWTDVPFEEGPWIYDVFSNTGGEVWMGGSSGEMYFSVDKGASWKKRNSPFNYMTRIAAISMSDTSSGIAGALDNLLFATRDNWGTFERLPTPLDQGHTYGNKPRYMDGRFFRVACWREFYLSDQCGITCYTRKDKINWKAFPEELLEFSVDPVSGRCFGVTQTLKPVELVSDGENVRLAEIGQKVLPARPLDIKAFDSTLYILDEDVYICRISASGFLRKPIMVRE